MATISSMTGIARGDVPRSVRHLETLGLLKTTSGGGSTVNVYTVVFDNDSVSAPVRTGVSSGADTVSAVELTGCPQIHTLGVRTGADLTDKEHTKEHKFARHASRERVDDAGDASGFKTFWRVYPSRRPHSNPKEPARLAFEAAVRRGIDAAVIIGGADNYAAYVRQHVSNPQHVAQAVTWLRQKRWNDHQQPPEPPAMRVGMY
jgi:hypothetical protein